MPYYTMEATQSLNNPGKATQGKGRSMKVCSYCGSTVHDNLITCPNCNATALRSICPRCGAAFDGAFCPACEERDEAARMADSERRRLEEAEDAANEGLGWKTALTVFLPFIGGYFLLREHVKAGFLLFGMLWCELFALIVGFQQGSSVGGDVMAVLLCMAPVAVYFFRVRKNMVQPGLTFDKVMAVAAILVLIASLTACFVNGFLL